ncbi:basic salivary proline-rich protein 3-like [Physeter macrocephalus]|uniref:Basic salivary proline-rich protein 3-like n=1 Tax=Physeter macrocephalus TaxID=9755 RepID=A0A9W2X2Y7_PHYMC|nr:basic salivary proline-rich protein 3-like [Physeter catodon]
MRLRLPEGGPGGGQRTRWGGAVRGRVVAPAVGRGGSCRYPAEQGRAAPGMHAEPRPRGCPGLRGAESPCHPGFRGAVMKFRTGVGGVLPAGQGPGRTSSRVIWPPEELWGEPVKEEFGGAKEVVPRPERPSVPLQLLPKPQLPKERRREAAGQPAVCWALQGNPSSSGGPGLDGVAGGRLLRPPSGLPPSPSEPGLPASEVPGTARGTLLSPQELLAPHRSVPGRRRGPHAVPSATAWASTVTPEAGPSSLPHRRGSEVKDLGQGHRAGTNERSKRGGVPRQRRHPPRPEPLQPLHEHSGPGPEDPALPPLQRHPGAPAGGPPHTHQAGQHLLPARAERAHAALRQGLPLRLLPPPAPARPRHGGRGAGCPPPGRLLAAEPGAGERRRQGGPVPGRAAEATVHAGAVRRRPARAQVRLRPQFPVQDLRSGPATVTKTSAVKHT